MKLSISNIAWDVSIDPMMLEILHHNSLDLEIAPTKIVYDNPYFHFDEALKYKEKLDQLEISVSSMQSIWFGRTENIFESKENRKILINYTKKAIDFAEIMGCKNLVFGSPRNRNMENKEIDEPIAISFFRKIGVYALKKGVVIAIEPNPAIYHTNFLNTTMEAIEFVKKVNIDSIKINYDLGTVIQNEEDISVLKENISFIHHIHISEPNLLPIEKRKIHKELFDILKENDYDKYVSIEMKQTDFETIKQIIDYVCELSR